MNEQPSASSIARFLKDNPDFFVRHAELFSELTVPHPSQPRAISLGERQIMVLRDRIKGFELRLAALTHQANVNESLSHKFTLWCARMLAEDDPQKLPEIIVSELHKQFDLSDIALRFWDLDHPDALDVDETIRDFAQSLETPYCGPDKSFPVTDWLKQKPASMAIVALKKDPDSQALGLLVIGSDNKDRFTEDMATDFLQTLSLLAASALSRLSPKTDRHEPSTA